MSEKITVAQALLESQRVAKDKNKGTVYTLRDGTKTNDRAVALKANR